VPSTCKVSEMKSLYTWIFLGFFAFSCSSGSNITRGSSLTYSTLRKSITRGQTRQNEIIKFLGSPSLVTKNSSGQEVWTYREQAFDAEKSEVRGIMLSGAAKPRSDVTSSSFDLILTFDDNGILYDYSVISSEY
jgi:outer membrane protein assembly factor BamE (lipoprotein component of BamABCDE complex)